MIPIDCSYQQQGDIFVCSSCGHTQSVSLEMRRNCTSESDTPVVARHKMLVRATKLCVCCEAFPCLGANDCRHEKALRAGKDCPQAKWFWC
jgi:hypothetical protein